MVMGKRIMSDYPTWTFEFPARPWTTNFERGKNRWERARLTKEWRTGFAWLASEQRVPRLEWCVITAQPWLGNRRGLQDTGACHPAVKAAVDGLVDAGLLLDDTPDIVRTITYLAPMVGRDALVLTIAGPPHKEKPK